MHDFSNYFNYFTEIEEHFQQARGTSLFLLSPLDWALVESWKASDVPLEAVLRGIDAAFEKWRARKSRVQQVNSLAFCAQAVLTEAQRSPDKTAKQAPAPFPENTLRAYLEANRDALLAAPATYAPIAESLEQILRDFEAETADLEALEQRLTMLEQKLIALARAGQPESEALAMRRELDRQLGPYRSKMSAEQLSMLEQQFLNRTLLEAARLPRLSLFYLK